MNNSEAIQGQLSQQNATSNIMQNLISLTTLIPGTLLNILVIIYFLLLSPHRDVITNKLLTLYSLFNALICLQITPLVASIFTSHPLITPKHCPLLLPLYNITSSLSTFFLAVLAVDIGLSLLYKTEQLLRKCKLVVMHVVYLCLLVVVELMQLRFGVEVQYAVERGICSWSSAGDNVVINYLNIGSLLAVIIPVFLITLSLFSLICNFKSISTYNHTLLYASQAALLLSVSYLFFHSVNFVASLRTAFSPLVSSQTVENQVHESGRLMKILLDGLYATIAPVLICLAVPDVRRKLFSCRVRNYDIFSS